MRQILALFLLGLVASTWAVQVAEKIPSMASSRMPKNILSEIAARIASEGPLDDIFGLFDTLESQIRKEQVEHDQLYEKQSAECKAEFSFRKKEISDAESALGAATQEKHACSTSLHQAKSQLDTNLKTQNDLESSIQTIDNQRNRDKADYDNKVKEFQNALNALEEGHKILQELYTGSATLIDLSRVTVRMFRSAVNLRNTNHYVPVIAALAQLSQKADLLIDPSVLERVEHLFKQLHDKIAAGLQELEQAESKAIDEYQQTRERLSTQLKQLKEAESVLRSQIANNEQCIVKANNIISQATAKKERNSNLLAEAQAMCKTFEEEYKVANEQRKEELALVDKLRKIVGDKLKFTHGVTKRASQYDNEFDKYQNQAKISDKPYVKQHNTYNADGAKLSKYERDTNAERVL